MASLIGISTCMGQQVQIGTAEIESAVEMCLTKRIENIQQQFEAEVVEDSNANAKKKEKAEKKRTKNKEKLEKKVRQKCASECEWSIFDMVKQCKPQIKIYLKKIKVFI